MSVWKSLVGGCALVGCMSGVGGRDVFYSNESTGDSSCVP